MPKSSVIQRPPFAVPPHPDRSGQHHALQVDGGWLVGFDAGEFGGGLWFTDGNAWTRLRPKKPAGTSSSEPFRAENVRGLLRISQRLVVLFGLNHLSTRSGRVFTVAPGAMGWEVRDGSVLDSAPESWTTVGDELRIVTDGGLWNLTPGGQLQHLYPIELGGHFPRALSVDREVHYIGLRGAVLELGRTPSGWRTRWYVPKECGASRSSGPATG